METIEVVTSTQRRRRYSVMEKVRMVEESNQPGMTVSYVARKYGISPSMLFSWRRRMAEGGKQAVQADEELVAASEVRALKKRIRDLERVLGKKTLENEILREAVELAHQKKLISRLPLLPGEDSQ